MTSSFIPYELSLNVDNIQVSQSELALAKLERRRDEYSAIGKLPNELLSKVFLEGRQEYWDSLTHHGRHNNTWLCVSEVCTRWRDVALNTPRFWGFVELAWDLQRTVKVLERSGSSPLYVRGEYFTSTVDERSTEFVEVLEATLSQTARIRHLDLSLPPSMVDKLVDWKSATILEALRLKFFDFTPLHRLAESMPALRTLVLTNVILTAPLPNLPCLERLSILHTTERSSIGSTWFVESLQNTPAVTVVEVKINNLTSASGEKLPAPVRLPNLSHLTFKANFMDAPIILNLVEHPASTILAYTFEGLTSEALPRFHSVATYVSRFSKECEFPINQVCIDVDGYMQLSIFTDQSHHQPHLSISLPKPHYLARRVDEEMSFNKSMDAFSAAPLSQIRGLVLAGFSTTDEYPVDFLEPFKAVEVLKLSNCREPLIDDPQPSSLEKLLMPRLKTIIISDYDHCHSDHQYYDYGQMFPKLFEVLAYRRSLGLPIEKVYVENCGFPPGTIEKLGELTEVVWRGHNRYS
ncbi:hypothetical protein ONZ45_g19674 [Pleurotus djamor]|nr:hypothetical protein ONZ45_g19674 [Pleurotus djamor]